MDHLRAVVLFADIREHPQALEMVAGVMEERVFPPSSYIIREGETGSEMFFLIEGQASVYKSTTEGEPYKVAILMGAQRAFFGEGALLDSDSRSASIRADSECRCLVLKRDAFDKFGASHPELALPVLRRIARAVMARLRKSNEDILLLYNALVGEIRGN
jgi:CRP-like cAMP-binding protein